MLQVELIAIYGLLQIELKSDELLINGIPVKGKHSDIANDALYIYKWLAKELKDVSEASLNKKKSVFNDIVKGLNKEYYLNMSLLTLFMLEWLFTNKGTKSQQILFIPKINRLIAHSSDMVKRHNEDSFNIIRDSKIGADNIMNIFNGGIEITKAMRRYKVAKWRLAVTTS